MKGKSLVLGFSRNLNSSRSILVPCFCCSLFGCTFWVIAGRTSGSKCPTFPSKIGHGQIPVIQSRPHREPLPAAKQYTIEGFSRTNKGVGRAHILVSTRTRAFLTSTLSKIRLAHTANMSYSNCRFYEEKYPEVESFVMVNVKQVRMSSCMSAGKTGRTDRTRNIDRRDGRLREAA